MPVPIDPHTFIDGPGNNASGEQVNQRFDPLYLALDGGLDEANVPNLAAAFTTYKRLERAVQRLPGSQAAGTYLLTPHLMDQGDTRIGPGPTAFPMDFAMELDPAIYNANSRTTKLRLQLSVFSNAVASAITYTVGLYPVTAIGGGASQQPAITAIGSVVAGSTVAVVNPPASARTKVDGTDFNFPAAGAYVLAVVTSGAVPATSYVHLLAQLEMRQV